MKKGLCTLPSDSERVLDADEEVFILYTELQAQNPDSDVFRGLGHVDSHQDVLTVNFRLTNPNPASKNSKPKKGRKQRHQDEAVELDIQIAQDKTSLRSRKGDTGSVVWKASVDFASMILQGAHFPSEAHPSLFTTSELKSVNVLELGAGTGILGVALSPFVRHYTVTDIPDLIPLIQKNLKLNFPSNDSNVTASPLDWIELQKSSPSNRSRYFNFNNDSSNVDLLLVVDCIYHPSLIPPLVETIDYLTIPDVTTVVVVVELRAEDVIREFLGTWLSLAGWEIWRVGIGSGEERIMKRPYAMWVGLKHNSL